MRTTKGRLSRAKAAVLQQEADVKAVVLNQPHRKWLGKTRRNDQYAESALGRLYLAGKITEAECWAGERWSKIVHEFHYVLASPAASISSPLGRMVGDAVDNPADADHLGKAGAASTDELLASEVPETDEERRDRVLNQHGGAMRTLRELADSRSTFLLLERVVLDGCTVEDDGDVVALRRGLDRLAQHWGLAPPADPEEAKKGPRVQVQAWPHTERSAKEVG